MAEACWGAGYWRLKDVKSEPDPYVKGTNFHELARRKINRIEKLLNHRPRKCLNYRTPYEVFREARGALDG